MKPLTLLTVAIAVLIQSYALIAQNYNDALLLSEPGLYTGARALSMGNSYTSLSDDISGLLFNPAGIGMVKNVKLFGGFSINSFNNNTTFFNNTTNANNTSANFNQFGLLYPLPVIQGSWVFGFGYNRVKDFNSIMEFDGFNGGNNSMIQTLTGSYNEVAPITYDLYLSYYDTSDGLDKTLIDGMLNQSGKIKKQGSIDNWSFATSVEVAKGFFIGGTFNILSGKYKSNSDYWEDDSRNYYGMNLELVPGDATTRDFQSFYLNDIIDWDLSGWDAQIGVLYNWINKFRFGASVKFPSYFTIKENYLVNANSYFGSGYEYTLNPAINSPAKYEIKTPYEYSFGASATISLLTVAADLKIMNYTEMEFTDGFDYSYLSDRNREIEDLFTTTLNYHLGAEFRIPIQIPLWGRAGFMYLPSPYANDPSEYDKKYLTAGAGTLIDDTFGIDLAYAYGWWKDYGDNYGSNVSRTYQDINVNNLFLNLYIKY